MKELVVDQLTVQHVVLSRASLLALDMALAILAQRCATDEVRGNA
jgi:hypothetical protein